MCIICQILAEQKAAREGEIGITTADSGQAESSLQRDQDKANINATNAEAVRKLAHAAQILDGINQSGAVKRVIGLIEQLVPAVPEAEPAPASTAASDVPPEIADLIRELGLNPEDVVVHTFPKV